MAKKRVYTDKEISAVLKRAAELQQVHGVTDTSGLSLEELEQIAAEVGIDPDHVKAAARELEAGSPDKQPFHLLGAPTSIDRERIVEGVVTDEVWEDVVGEIQRTYGAAGETGRRGRTREWVQKEQTGERVHVAVSALGDQARIRVRYNMSDWAVGLHVTLMALTVAPIILQFVLLSLGPLVETGLALFIVFAFHMIARLAFGGIARKQDRKARKLLTRLDELIAAPEADADLPEADVALHEDGEQQAASEAGRISPTLLSDAAPPEEDAPTRRRNRNRI